jgi:hypothetical protein
MNWKRGLWRVWMVGSVIWIGYWYWEIWLICRFGVYPPPRCANEIPWTGLAIISLGGPLIALEVGLVAVWIVRGFR